MAGELDLGLVVVVALGPQADGLPIRSNIAPSQKVLTIRFNPETQQRSNGASRTEPDRSVVRRPRFHGTNISPDRRIEQLGACKRQRIYVLLTDRVSRPARLSEARRSPRK